MTVRHICALGLLFIGTGVLLLSTIALVFLPRPYDRLHALTPATSLGAPLVALALAVETGPGRAAVKLLVVAALIVSGGPVTTMAIGRATAQDEGLLRKDSPQ